LSLPLTELVIAAAWGIAVAVLIVAMARWRRGKGMRSRLAALRLGPSWPASGSESPPPTLRRSIAALGGLLGTRSGASFDQLAQLINAAGLTGRIAPAEVLGWKLILTCLGLLSTLILCLAHWRLSLLLPVLLVAGWSGPTMCLKYCRQQRLRHLVRDLPTVIDLLALSLDGGMGLDRAIGVICDRVPSPLSDELRHVLSDVGLGMSRQEAFEHLSERVPSDDVRLLSNSIIQSEQLGSSLVSTVRNQARLLRVGRRRAAETQALKAPVKMLLPMVLFILPTLFLVVLGPPALNMTKALAQGHP
jgi:Flp pilus assembly protein TadB